MTKYRAAMGQERLNHLMVISLNADIVNKLDLNDIANKFIEGKPRRFEYFGHFGK